MAFNSDAIYRVRGQVSGTRDVRELADAMARIGPAAARSAGGVSQLGRSSQAANQSTRGLNQALGGLASVGAALGLERITSGLTRMGGQSLVVGEQSMMLDIRLKAVTGSVTKYNEANAMARDAAKRFGMSQMDAANAVASLNARLVPLGKSSKLIEDTFYGVIQAGRAMGQNAYDINAAFLQVGQMLSGANAQWDEMRILMERIPQLGAAMVKAFNQVREDKGLVLITKEEAQQQEQIIKDSAKRQTETLQDTIRDQKTSLERQTEDSNREINKRYKDHERALKESIERQDRQIKDKYNRELEALRQNLEDQRRLRDNQTSDQEDNDRELIRDKYEQQRLADQRYREDYDEKNQAYLDSLSETEKKAVQRRIEDERREYDKALAKQEEEELKSFDRTAEEKRIKQERVDQKEEEKLTERITARQKKEEDALQRREETAMQSLNDRQTQELRKVEETSEKQLDVLQRRLAEETKLIDTATKNQLAEVLAKTRVTYNELKDLVSKGLIKPDVLEKTMEILRKDTAKLVPPPGPVQEFNAALADMNKEIGDKLLPALTPVIRGITELIRGFNGLPDPVKGGLVVLGVLGTTLGGLLLTIGLAVSGVLSLVGAYRQLAGLPPLKLPALGGGRLPSAGPVQPPSGVPSAGGRLPSGVPSAGPVQPPTPAWAQQPGMGPRIPTGTGPKPPGPGIPRTQPAWAVGPRGGGTLPGLPSPPPPAPPPPATVKGAGELLRIGASLKGLWQEIAAIIRGVAGHLAGPLLQGLTRFGSVLGGMKIGATISGWLGAVGPAVAGIKGALVGVGAWITGTFLPGLAAFFAGPLGWAVLGVALVAAVYTWREPLTNFLFWVDEQFRKASNLMLPTAEKWAQDVSNGLLAMKNNVDFELQAIGGMFGLLKDDAITAWEGITEGLDYFNQKGNELLDSFQKFANEKWEGIKQGLSNAIAGMIQGTQNSLSNLASTLAGPFESAARTIKNILNSIIGAAEWAINRAVDGVNIIANGINAITRNSPIPIPMVPTLSYARLPRLARGGWFDRATIAEIGEGGDPGGEYAIPARQMPAALAAWNSGARGEALVRQMQTGLVPGSSLGAPSGGGSAAPPRTLNMPITIQNAYVLPDGTQAVAMEDVLAIAQRVHKAAVQDAVEASIRVVTSPQMKTRIHP